MVEWCYADGMDKFFAALVTPFMLAACLLIAWPIKRWVQTRMKDGPLRRFLLIRWD